MSIDKIVRCIDNQRDQQTICNYFVIETNLITYSIQTKKYISVNTLFK